MNSLLDLIYQLITRPKTALYAITAGERWQAAGIIWLFTVFILSLSSFVKETGMAAAFLICLITSAVSLLIHSAVTDYIAGLWGGRGTARGITAGFMASSLPYGFLVFAALLSRIPGGEILYSFIFFFALIWSWILDVIAISENYAFSTGKAVVVALMPWLIGAALFLVLLLAGITAAVSGLSQMEDLGTLGNMMEQI